MTRSLPDTFAAFGIRDAAAHDDPDSAVERATALYEQATSRLAAAFHRFTREGVAPAAVDAFYPFLGVRVGPGDLNLDGRLAYGALHDPGTYGTTLTAPRLFGDYYRTQVGILMHNHRVPVVTGVSTRPIPLPFVVEAMTEEVAPERLHEVQHLFPMPDLSYTDDSIANGTWRAARQEP